MNKYLQPLHPCIFTVLAIIQSACHGEVISTEVFLNSASVVTVIDSNTEQFLSNTLTTAAGATFRLQFDATAGAGVLTATGGTNDLGVMSTASDDAQFDVNTDVVSFGNLAIVNFAANASSLTLTNLVIDGFNLMSFSAAGATSDSGNIDGVTWTQPDSSHVTFAPTNSTTLTHVSGTWRLNSIGIQVSTAAVPEPSSFGLLGMAGFCFAFYRHQRKHSHI